MSSVEIRIKGIKNVKGLKTKRGKARRKINRKKQQALISESGTVPAVFTCYARRTIL